MSKEIALAYTAVALPKNYPLGRMTRIIKVRELNFDDSSSSYRRGPPRDQMHRMRRGSAYALQLATDVVLLSSALLLFPTCVDLVRMNHHGVRPRRASLDPLVPSEGTA
jgi:hypothetical protein